MEDKTITVFKQMVQNLNKYTESKDLVYLEGIKNELKDLFNADYVKFWKYNKNNEQIVLLDKESKSLTLEDSLTKRAMDSKSITLINHLSSEKYYVPSIDNPLDLKIKSLIIFPIIYSGRVYGVLKLARGIKERKIFTKKNRATLEELSIVFLKIMLFESMSKEELNEHLPAPIKKGQLEKNKTINLPKKNNVKTVNKMKESREEQIFIEKEKEFRVKILKYEDELNKRNEKYTSLEKSFIEVELALKESRGMLENVKEENSTLRHEQKNKLQTIVELEKQTFILQKKQTNNIDKNFECILQRFDKLFAQNEHAYTLFELLTYALSSEKGMAYIEEKLKKSKLLQQLIDGYYFNSDLLVKQDKYRILDFVKHTKSYEKDIFLNAIKLNIIINDSVRSSLVLDAEKIQSIILHLLLDLYEFVDHSEMINICFDFKNKFLNIEIGGAIHRKNSLFKTMFKQTQLSGDEKNRLGLQFSKKVVSRLKGEINYLYEDNYYKFIVAVPVQVIKM